MIQHVVVFFHRQHHQSVYPSIERCWPMAFASVRLVDLRRCAAGGLPADQVGLGRLAVWMKPPVCCDHALPLVWSVDRGIAEAAGLVRALCHLGRGDRLAWPKDLAEALQARAFSRWKARPRCWPSTPPCGPPEPLCAGCPNALDLEQVADLVARVTANLELAEPAALDLRRLDYLSPSLRGESASKNWPRSRR